MMMETDTGQVAMQFLFTDRNVLVKTTDTIVFCIYISVLGRASTYFTQLLCQPDRMNRLPLLDMSENSVVYIQALLGAIYNIEG